MAISEPGPRSDYYHCGVPKIAMSYAYPMMKELLLPERCWRVVMRARQLFRRRRSDYVMSEDPTAK